jgi:hypothetical protein
VAVSWHGPDYDKPLRQRSQECDQLFAFLTLMRKNNMNIPIISEIIKLNILSIDKERRNITDCYFEER